MKSIQVGGFKSFVVACAGLCAFAAAATETNVVEVGQTLRIETGTELSQDTALILRGTLDLNGHDVNVLSLSCLTSAVGADGWKFASTDAQITNSAPGNATFTVGNGDTGATYFTGSVAPNVDFVCNGYEAQIFTGDKRFAPASFTMKRATGMVFSIPTKVYFKFMDVAADNVTTNKLLRLAELAPTYKGVPIPVWHAELGSSPTGYYIGSNAPANWRNLGANDHQFWNANVPISPEAPAYVGLSTGSSGGTNSVGCVRIDGYRMSPPAEPAFTPTTWEVMVGRAEFTGLIVVDRRENDPLNRTEVKSTLEADTWSMRLSQNFEFNQLKLGSPFGENTDVVVESGATLRVAVAEPFKVGNVSGAGTIQIDDGSTFAPKSMDGWTGKFTTKYCDGENREAKVAVGDGKWNASIDNTAIVLGGADAGEVVYDGTTAGTLASKRLVDGDGTLGVRVDVGADGVQNLGNFGASYTGDTKIESGTLKVVGDYKSVTAKYIRIAPKKVVGPEDKAYHIWWAMNEFAIYDAEGKAISLKGSTVTASNTSKQWNGDSVDGRYLIDGDAYSRCLPYGDNYVTVTIQPASPVTFSSYDWFPTTNGKKQGAADLAPVKYRFPTEWEILVSQDGSSWETADYRAIAAPSTDAGYLAWQGGEGHFPLNGGVRAQELPTLPEEFTGASAPGAAFVETVKAQYFRFRPYETFFGGNFTNAYDYGWHVSEFSLMKDGKIVPWPAGVTLTRDGCNLTTTTFGNKLANFANNVHTGGVGNVSDAVRCFFDQCGGYVEVNAHEPLEFDAYMLWNGPMPDYHERLPRVWSLAVSNDKENWRVIDRHLASPDDVCPEGAYQPYGPFSLKYRWPINGAGNAIGDKSKVSIVEGATLSLAASFERVGGLAGLGSVFLADSTLSLNACQPATFSGAVSGSGDLEVVGEGTQSFDGADLSAVKTLALNGGAIDGTASFGGNALTVAFDGGATWAALSGIGALTVTGDVKVAAPEDVRKEGGELTLFSYDSIDADSKAALEAATLVGGLPRGCTFEVVVGEKSAKALILKNGFMIMVR